MLATTAAGHVSEGQKEAAEMAILNAENVMKNKRDGVHYMDDVDKPMFRAALAAYKEFPDRLKV